LDDIGRLWQRSSCRSACRFSTGKSRSCAKRTRRRSGSILAIVRGGAVSRRQQAELTEPKKTAPPAPTPAPLSHGVVPNEATAKLSNHPQRMLRYVP
jgi:hypothetical protein